MVNGDRMYEDRKRATHDRRICFKRSAAFVVSHRLASKQHNLFLREKLEGFVAFRSSHRHKCALGRWSNLIILLWMAPVVMSTGAT